jgi:hypothetical protein
MLKGPPFSRTTAALICVVFVLIELSSLVETPCYDLGYFSRADEISAGPVNAERVGIRRVL